MSGDKIRHKNKCGVNNFQCGTCKSSIQKEEEKEGMLKNDQGD